MRMCPQEAAPLRLKYTRKRTLNSCIREPFVIETIISKIKSGYNTACVVFFLILPIETRTKSINTKKTVLVFLNEKVLPQPGNPGSGAILSAGKSRLRVSGFRCQEDREDRAQKTDDRRQGGRLFSILCHPTSVLCYLTMGTAAL